MKYWWMFSIVLLLASCAHSDISTEQQTAVNESQSPASTMPAAQTKFEPDPDLKPILPEDNFSKTQMPQMSSLPNLGPAPELKNDIWLNSDKPLRLEGLRGKVVLIDMWTFG